ncbi:MAG: glycosyltransferase [Planctomycetes bacterium]|nr:glycosyltransferase [Planctomycetota bacterium]
MQSGGRHILHVFPGFDPGGTQVRTVQLMGMLPSDVRHSVVSMDGSYRSCQQAPAGVQVVALEQPPRLGLLAMGRYMRRVLAEQRPDAVMTYNWGAIEMLLGARGSGIPLIHHEDGFGPEEADRLLRRRTWIRRLLLRRAAAVAVPSRVLEEIALTRWRVPRARVHYLPNGVDLQRFHPVERDPGRRVVVGHVGHLRPEKNQTLLLTAFAQGPARRGALLRMVGAGVEEDRLRRLAAALGVADQVDFVGRIADTAPVYADMDLFVLSSDTEQMPLTVLEAMASGLPVASTDVGDVRNMVAPVGRQWITPRRDAAALAASLDALVADPGLRERIGAANRAHCSEAYDTHACYRAWIEFYLDTLGWVPSANAV